VKEETETKWGKGKRSGLGLSRSSASSREGVTAVAALEVVEQVLIDVGTDGGADFTAEGTTEQGTQQGTGHGADSRSGGTGKCTDHSASLGATPSTGRATGGSGSSAQDTTGGLADVAGFDMGGIAMRTGSHGIDLQEVD